MKKTKKFFKASKPAEESVKSAAFKFPNIPRFIPERLHLVSLKSPAFITAFACGFMLMAILVIGSEVNKNLNKITQINSEREIIKAQLTEWKGIVTRYPNYKDGYYMLSILEYRLGNNNSAFNYINQALLLDPDYKEAKELRYTLQKE